MTVASAAPLTPYSSTKINIGSKMKFNIVPTRPITIGILVSPSPAKIARKNKENTTSPIPYKSTFKYVYDMSKILPYAPNSISSCFPKIIPNADRTTVITTPRRMVCSAQLSAFFLSFWPINCAIEAVTPAPSPTVNPIIIKNNGLTNATAVTSSAPNHPINIISTTLNRV